MSGPARTHDLRLAFPAAGAWLAAVPADGLRPTTAVATAGVAALAAALLGRRGGLRAAAVLLGVAVGAGSAALHVSALHRGPLARVVAQRSTRTFHLVVTVARDPVSLASAHGSRFVLVDATVVAVGPRAAHSPVVVLAHGGGWTGLLPGQRVQVSARVRPARHGDLLTATVLAAGPPRLLGRPPVWQRAAGAMRAALRRACLSLPPDERGLVPGLVLGDVSAMPASLTRDFRYVGLTHLNAVSGANVAIVLGTLLGLLRRVGVRRRWQPALAAAGLAAFVVLVRPSPSVLRAAAMGSVALLALSTGRRAQPIPALSAAVLVLVAVDPFLARSVGFALSVLATGAIVVLAPAWSRRLARSMPRPLAVGVAVAGAAQLACTPVLVAVFGQLSPWSVPANLLAAPAVAPATLAGVACALVAVLWPGAAGVLAWVAAVPAAWLAVVARSLARLPGSAATWPRGATGILLLAVAATALLALVRVLRRRRPRAMLATWRP